VSYRVHGCCRRRVGPLPGRRVHPGREDAPVTGQGRGLRHRTSHRRSRGRPGARSPRRGGRIQAIRTTLFVLGRVLCLMLVMTSESGAVHRHLPAARLAAAQHVRAPTPGRVGASSPCRATPCTGVSRSPPGQGHHTQDTWPLSSPRSGGRRPSPSGRGRRSRGREAAPRCYRRRLGRCTASRGPTFVRGSAAQNSTRLPLS
jgi:hypothetical protein